MVINYIILAFKEPQQVKRLVERLYMPHTYFYIHIDKNVADMPFLSLLKNKERVIFLPPEKRVASAWGSMAVVEATLNAVKEIIKDNRQGYTVLMSGQCYPIKNNGYIHDFFEKHYGYNFIEGFLPESTWTCSRIRLNQYTFFITAKRNDLISVPSFKDISVKQLLNKKLAKKYYKLLIYRPKDFWILFKRRNHPATLTPFGGMAYWAFPLETLKFIMDFVANHPSFVRYHFYTLYPDELFFQTIIHNYFDKVERPTTFANWPDDIVTSPQTFTTADFTTLRKRPELFARKFDYGVDTKILDLIDKELLFQANEMIK